MKTCSDIVIKYGTFFGPFFGPFFWTILSEGGRLLILREGWDGVYQYSVLRKKWEADCCY